MEKSRTFQCPTCHGNGYVIRSEVLEEWPQLMQCSRCAGVGRLLGMELADVVYTEDKLEIRGGQGRRNVVS